MKTDVVLLPGLHGSTALFQTFIALAPPWANCLPIAFPERGAQAFDVLAGDVTERLRVLEGFVLFGESFAAPIAARVAERLGQKVSLLVLCNPLVEAPLRIAPSFAAPLLQSRMVPRFLVAHAMTGGNQALAGSVLREVRRLPREVLAERLAVASTASAGDLRQRLSPPVLGIVGSRDRLLSPRATQALLGDVAQATITTIVAPHLAAQAEPAAVWEAIDEEFRSAA